MRYSGIGGQAVMEGVMMRNGDKYAVAVRKPDHEIEVGVEEASVGAWRGQFYRFSGARYVYSDVFCILF